MGNYCCGGAEGGPKTVSTKTSRPLTEPASASTTRDGSSKSVADRGGYGSSERQKMKDSGGYVYAGKEKRKELIAKRIAENIMRRAGREDLLRDDLEPSKGTKFEDRRSSSVGEKEESPEKEGAEEGLWLTKGKRGGDQEYEYAAEVEDAESSVASSKEGNRAETSSRGGEASKAIIGEDELESVAKRKGKAAVSRKKTPKRGGEEGKKAKVAEAEEEAEEAVPEVTGVLEKKWKATRSRGKTPVVSSRGRSATPVRGGEFEKGGWAEYELKTFKSRGKTSKGEAKEVEVTEAVESGERRRRSRKTKGHASRGGEVQKGVDRTAYEWKTTKSKGRTPRGEAKKVEVAEEVAAEGDVDEEETKHKKRKSTKSRGKTPRGGQAEKVEEGDVVDEEEGREHKKRKSAKSRGKTPKRGGVGKEVTGAEGDENWAGETTKSTEKKTAKAGKKEGEEEETSEDAKMIYATGKVKRGGLSACSSDGGFHPVAYVHRSLLSLSNAVNTSVDTQLKSVAASVRSYAPDIRSPIIELSRSAQSSVHSAMGLNMDTDSDAAAVEEEEV